MRLGSAISDIASTLGNGNGARSTSNFGNLLNTGLNIASNLGNRPTAPASTAHSQASTAYDPSATAIPPADIIPNIADIMGTSPSAPVTSLSAPTTNMTMASAPVATQQASLDVPAQAGPKKQKRGPLSRLFGSIVGGLKSLASTALGFVSKASSLASLIPGFQPIGLFSSIMSSINKPESEKRFIQT